MENDTHNSPSFSSRRRLSLGANVALGCLAVLAIVIMINYLGARHSRRWHLTSENPNQLSALTANFLRSLTNRVKIIVFFDRQDSSGVYSSVSALLTEYQLANPNLQLEFVDYLRNPAAALMVKDRYKLTFPDEDSTKNIVIFDCEGRIKTVYEKQLYDLDINEALSGQSRRVKRINFKGELLFTSALINVTDLRRFKIGFVQGHGEHNLQDDDPIQGYTKFASLLQQMNLDVGGISLSTTEISTNYELLVIAGPRQQFESAELDKLDRFLNQGGRLLLLFNYSHLAQSGLENYLAAWGVRVGRDWIMETQTTRENTETISANPLIVTNYLTPSHPVIRPLLRSRLLLALPRTVEKMPSRKETADSPRVDALAASNPNAIAVTEFPNGSPSPDAFRDRRGAIPLLVAVEKGVVQGLSTDRGATRMIIAGDSVFFGNEMLDHLANRDFAVLAVNWLLDRSKLMGGIGPRPVKEFHVVMTSAQLFAAKWILMAGLPGGIMAIGYLVWFRRRK